MVQIKHFTAPQKMPNVQFSRRAKWPWREKILGAPQPSQKIIVNQSKPILVIASISMKPFTRQSFRQNSFSRELLSERCLLWDSLLTSKPVIGINSPKRTLPKVVFRADKGWAVKRARPSKKMWCSGLGLCLQMSPVFACLRVWSGLAMWFVY